MKKSKQMGDSGEQKAKEGKERERESGFANGKAVMGFPQISSPRFVGGRRLSAGHQQTAVCAL